MHLEPAFPAESLPHRPHLFSGYDSEPRHGDFPAPALLIQVPHVGPLVRSARRPSAAATARVRAHGAPAVPARSRKRRLRREVRMAGYVLATVVPMALAAALLRGAPAPTGSGHDVRTRIAAEIRPPAVSITFDPTALKPLAEPKSAVEFPGYLLPEEGAEEPAHAGG
jgi:hypothetical protein